MTGSPIYLAVMLTTLIASAFFWSRRYRRQPELVWVFLGGVIGAFVGAKIVFLLAEGWVYLGRDDLWVQLASGKTITGALLGGYAGIEIAKKRIGYKEATGDFFALMVPLGMIVGRLGCLHQGCCLGTECAPDSWYAFTDMEGIPRWPAVPAEMIFNAVALIVILSLRRLPALRGQWFHLYLIAYGLFRFVHEFWRDTPRLLFSVTGYQIAALGILLLGILRFRQRRRAHVASSEPSDSPGS